MILRVISSHSSAHGTHTCHIIQWQVQDSMTASTKTSMTTNYTQKILCVIVAVLFVVLVIFWR